MKNGVCCENWSAAFSRQKVHDQQQQQHQQQQWQQQQQQHSNTVRSVGEVVPAVALRQSVLSLFLACKKRNSVFQNLKEKAACPNKVSVYLMGFKPTT